MAQDYTDLITSAYRNKPLFVAIIQLLAGTAGQIADETDAIPFAFDLDVAVGAQLDVIGLWVGLSRKVSVPISDAYFTWDNPKLGWDHANWKGQYEPSQGIVFIDDNLYRIAIRAKIKGNYWDGTNEGLKQITDTISIGPGVYCAVIDNFDMTVSLYVTGFLTAAAAELVRRGVMQPKAGAVRIEGAYYSPEGPVFALDYETGILAGLDVGAFAKDL